MSALLVASHFTPIRDHDVPRLHQVTVAKYRSLAVAHGVHGFHYVCYNVRSGFTLKQSAPKAGPCNNGFDYLQGWEFPDDPTQDSFVFWVPRILVGSCSKTADLQSVHLAEIRRTFELPVNHLTSFGPASLVAGLMLAHHKITGERVPFDQYTVRTDTCPATGGRLLLGWGDVELCCDDWLEDDRAGDYVGALALGMERGF